MDLPLYRTSSLERKYLHILLNMYRLKTSSLRNSLVFFKEYMEMFAYKVKIHLTMMIY